MKLTKKICLTTTFDKLRASNACESGYKKLAITLGGVAAYGRDKDIPLTVILDSNGVDDCLWALRAVDHPERDRISRYIACDCADAVLHIHESEAPNDNRPRHAIEVARNYL